MQSTCLFSSSKAVGQKKERSNSDELVHDIDVHTKDPVRLMWAEMPYARGARFVTYWYRVALDRSCLKERIICHCNTTYHSTTR